MATNEKNMKTFRIGNEIQIRWPILTNGEEDSLSGRDLRLFLCDQWGNDREVTTFGTEGNVIVFTFYASEQLKTGVYRLTLYENLGKEHQLATDYCFAFRLVSHSHEIPDDMSSKELPLDSTNLDVGIHGLSAYEIAVNYGYEGSEEEWMQGFDTVLHSTEIVVAATERSERVLQRSEELMAGLTTLNESEQGRVDAEAGRVSNEEQRVQNESDRQAAERQRVSSESQRAQTFTANESQRQQTFEAGEVQRGQTASQNESGRQQTFEAGETTRQETFETNEGKRESRLGDVISDVQNAEALRVAAESDREAAESERQSSESTRRLNENTRQAAETTRNSNESLRRQAETRRGTNEDERIQNELLRQAAETARMQQDEAIAEAEGSRVTAERGRVSAESARVLAEQAREAAMLAAQQSVQTAINDWNRTRQVIQTENEVEIQPNVKNIWEEPIEELTITLAAGVEGYDNEYMIQFKCPEDSATVLHLPQSIVWMDDEPLEPEAGWMYQISIVENFAVFAGFEIVSE
jgi:hypothetical protein